MLDFGERLCDRFGDLLRHPFDVVAAAERVDALADVGLESDHLLGVQPKQRRVLRGDGERLVHAGDEHRLASPEHGPECPQRVAHEVQLGELGTQIEVADGGRESQLLARR